MKISDSYKFLFENWPGVHKKGWEDFFADFIAICSFGSVCFSHLHQMELQLLSAWFFLGFYIQGGIELDDKECLMYAYLRTLLSHNEKTSWSS